jgi:hypothetical protein
VQLAHSNIDAPKRFTYHGGTRTDVDQKVAMQPNIRFIAYSAIIAIVYMTIVSSLDDISRLILVCSLFALMVIIEKRAPKA